MTIDFLVKKIEIDKQAFYQFKSSSSGCDKSIEFFFVLGGGACFGLFCWILFFVFETRSNKMTPIGCMYVQVDHRKKPLPPKQ